MTTRDTLLLRGPPEWAATLPLTVERIESAFYHASGFTIGVEEELMPVDPETFDLAPAIEEVLALVAGDHRFDRELRGGAGHRPGGARGAVGGEAAARAAPARGLTGPFSAPPPGGTTGATMAPRALWTGSIAFGLVNVPVRLYTAVHEHRLKFHLIHEPDDGPIGYEKICKLEGKPVDSDEIVKAYEVEKGQLVQLTDEDFESVEVEGVHTIDLTDFVPYDDIDPTFFAHTYLVGPQEGAEKTYALLVRAMRESGLAGIGKFVMRNRQYLGCLHVRCGTLTLEQLHFADEVDAPSGIIPESLPPVAKRELDMALQLIEGFSGAWQPERYEDTYTDALREVVEAKLKGHEMHRAREPEPDEHPDLMEALRRSLEQARASGRSRPSHTSRNGGGKLSSLSKKELQARARKLGIEGRSRMSREELAKAVTER